MLKYSILILLFSSTVAAHLTPEEEDALLDSVLEECEEEDGILEEALAPLARESLEPLVLGHDARFRLGIIGDANSVNFITSLLANIDNQYLVEEMRGNIDGMLELMKRGTKSVDPIMMEAYRHWERADELKKRRLETAGRLYLLQEVEAAEELKELEAFITKIGESLHFARSPIHMRLLYIAFFEFVKRDKAASRCMLCLRPMSHGGIGDSHYTPNAMLHSLKTKFVKIGSNQLCGAKSITRKMYCKSTKTNKSPCEGLFSKLGEDDLPKFIKFFEEVIKVRVEGPMRDIAWTYDRSFFYLIAANAFRNFMVLVADDEKILHSFRHNIREQFEFFFELRRYLLNPDEPTNLKMRLYISENGLRGVDEVPVDATPLLFGAHFAFRGFHFVLTRDGEVENFYRSGREFLKLSDPHVFEAEIHPHGGRLVVEQSHRLRVPKIIKKIAADSRDSFVRGVASLNPSTIVAIHKEKADPKGASVTLKEECASSTYIRLPDFIRFIPGPQGRWHPGMVSVRNDNIKQLSFVYDPIRKEAIWLFEHEKARYRFLVMHFGLDGSEVVIGVEVDYRDDFNARFFADKLFSLRERVLNDEFFLSLGFEFRALRGTEYNDILTLEPLAMSHAAFMAGIEHFIPRHYTEDEIAANLESIRAMTRMQTIDGREHVVRVRPCALDGNCGFCAIDVDREDFITRVFMYYAAHQDRNDPESQRFMRLLNNAMREIGLNDGLTLENVANWADTYNARNEDGHAEHWLDEHHMRLLSFLYNIRILTYTVDPTLQNPAFIPLQGANREIYENRAQTFAHEQAAQVVDIAWVFTRALRGQNGAPTHFERLIRADHHDDQRIEADAGGNDNNAPLPPVQEGAWRATQWGAGVNGFVRAATAAFGLALSRNLLHYGSASRQ